MKFYLKVCPCNLAIIIIELKHIRMIFQDPNSTFDPKMNAGQILDTPLHLNTRLDEHDRNQKFFRL